MQFISQNLYKFLTLMTHMRHWSLAINKFMLEFVNRKQSTHPFSIQSRLSRHEFNSTLLMRTNYLSVFAHFLCCDWRLLKTFSGNVFFFLFCSAIEVNTNSALKIGITHNASNGSSDSFLFTLVLACIPYITNGDDNWPKTVEPFTLTHCA